MITWCLSAAYSCASTETSPISSPKFHWARSCTCSHNRTCSLGDCHDKVQLVQSYIQPPSCFQSAPLNPLVKLGNHRTIQDQRRFFLFFHGRPWHQSCVPLKLPRWCWHCATFSAISTTCCNMFWGYMNTQVSQATLQCRSSTRLEFLLQFRQVQLRL